MEIKPITGERFHWHVYTNEGSPVATFAWYSMANYRVLSGYFTEEQQIDVAAQCAADYYSRPLHLK